MVPPTNIAKPLFFGGLFLFASTAHCAPGYQTINVIWSTGDFSTLSGPGGTNQIGHSTGFVLTDLDGNTIYSNEYPNDYRPCALEGHTFTLTDGCFGDVEYKFRCASKNGTPQSCEVLDSGDHVIASGEGDRDTDFFGIGIAQTGYCGTSFTMHKDLHCEPGSTGFTVS